MAWREENMLMPGPFRYESLCAEKGIEIDPSTMSTLEKINHLREKHLFEAGTPDYMAPEVVDWGYKTEAADIYSMGTLMSTINSHTEGFRRELSNRLVARKWDRLILNMRNSIPAMRITMPAILKEVSEIADMLDRGDPRLGLSKMIDHLKLKKEGR